MYLKNFFDENVFLELFEHPGPAGFKQEAVDIDDSDLASAWWALHGKIHFLLNANSRQS